jgi:hypothetical protein
LAAQFCAASSHSPACGGHGDYHHAKEQDEAGGEVKHRRVHADGRLGRTDGTLMDVHLIEVKRGKKSGFGKGKPPVVSGQRTTGLT